MNREKHIRNALLIISLLAIFMAISGMDFGLSNRYDDLLVDDSTYSDIKETRTELKEEQSPQLYFDDFQIHYDSLNNHYLYSLIEDSPSKDNPTIRSVSQEYSSYDIVILNDVLSDESIKANNKAHILVYDDETYKEYTLSATTLPIVSINMNAQTDDRDNPIESYDKRARFEMFDNREGVQTSERLVTSQTYIRLRGASSLNFPKNQFRLNLREFSIGGNDSNNHLSLLDMREDDDWILYSPYNDPEKMRNTFSNNLWYDVMGENNPYGINTGTKGEFVEVFIDGMYWGIYTLMYPIDNKGLNLNVDNSPTSDFYYRSVSNIPFEENHFLSNSKSYQRGRFNLRDPEPNGDKYQWTPIVEHMRALKYDKESLEEHLINNSYLPNQIDYYLFVLLLQATDNDRKNHNYLAIREENHHRIIESPWDLDLTWGLHWTSDHPLLSTFRGDSSVQHIPLTSHINTALNQGNGNVISQVKDRYSELRESSWSNDHLLSYIDEFDHDIYGSGSILRNRERWPDAAYSPDTQELRTYIVERLKYMDEYIAKLSGGLDNNE